MVRIRTAIDDAVIFSLDHKHSNHMFRNFLIVLSMLPVPALLNAQIDFSDKTWDHIRSQAQKEQKIIFVDAFTEWCGPCKWMAGNVFTDPVVGEFYNAHFVNLKLDMEKGEGLDFASEYKVNAYPTLLFIDGSGALLHKYMGAVPSDRFIEIGHDALNPDKRLSTLINAYDANKHDKAFLQNYLIRMLGAGMDVTEAGRAYLDMLEYEEFVTSDNLMILQLLEPSSDSKAFDMLYRNRHAFTALADAATVNEVMKDIVTSDLYRTIYTEDIEGYHRTMSILTRLDVPFREEVTTMGKMLFAQAQDDTDNYMEHAYAYCKKYNWNSWSVLNNTAWDMYLNRNVTSRHHLKVANSIAKRAVKMEANYYTTDTYAAIFYKSGKYKKAMQWANKAVELAQAAGEDPIETEGLILRIEEAMLKPHKP